MPDESQHQDDAETVAQVCLLLTRAGLKLSAEEILDLVPLYRRECAMLDRLREMVEPGDELSLTFRAAPREHGWDI